MRLRSLGCAERQRSNARFSNLAAHATAQAWLGANLGMATAMRMLDAGIDKVCGSRDACRLLHLALQECHRQLMQVRIPVACIAYTLRSFAAYICQVQ